MALDRRVTTAMVPPLAPAIRNGARWSAVSVTVSRFGSFAIGVVVARLLTPLDFAAFAVALVIYAIIINVSELGVSTAIVRGGTDSDRLAPTVATISYVTSAILTVATIASAVPLTRALGNDRAAGAVMLMASTVFLAGLSAVPSALLKRDFEQKKLFLAETANAVVGGIVVVILAIAGFGVFALAWSRVAGQLVSTIALLLMCPQKVRPGFHRATARWLLRFGLPLSGANIIVFLLLNVDYVVIGRKLGPIPLGLYLLAFNICAWPITIFSSVIRSVSLPAFGRLRDDEQDMPASLNWALGLVCRIALPVCFVLGALGMSTVTAVYGSRWSAAGPAMAGLAVLGAVRVVSELFADFLVALGRTREILIIQAIWVVALVPALLIGAGTAGIRGVGWSHAIVAAGVALPTYLFFLHRAGVSPASLGRSAAPGLAIGLTAAAAGALCAHLVSGSGAWFMLLIGSAAAGVVYLFGLYPMLSTWPGRTRSA